MLAPGIRVVVVDDDEDVRALVCGALGDTAAVHVVGHADDGVHATALVERLQPDIVVMDFRMPEVDGVEATRRVLAARPGTEVIGFSAGPAAADAFLEAGARCFFDKLHVGRLAAYLLQRAEGGQAVDGAPTRT